MTPRNAPYSVAMREKMIDLYKQGNSMRSVARILKISTSTANRVIKKYLSTGSVEYSSDYRREPSSFATTSRRNRAIYERKLSNSDDEDEDDDSVLPLSGSTSRSYDFNINSKGVDKKLPKQASKGSDYETIEIDDDEDEEECYQPFYQEIFVTEEIMLD